MGQNDGGRKSYESTVMRMAGNIAPIVITQLGAGSRDVGWSHEQVARISVAYARFIVAEVLRTELPKEKE